MNHSTLRATHGSARSSFLVALALLALGVGVWRHKSRVTPRPLEDQLIVMEPDAEPEDEPVTSAVPAPLTAAQHALKTQLETQVHAAQPTHRLTLRDGSTVTGWLENETANQVRFRESAGYSGYMISSYQRSELKQLEPLPATPVEITRADLRLHEEFPAFHFVKVPACTIVTDAPYSDVEKTVRLLTELHQQFRQHFAALLHEQAAPPEIQVVFFSAEEPFRAYTRRVAPGLASGSAGFFTRSQNRLVLLNQLGTAQYAHAQARAAQFRRDRRGDITSEAKSMTERLIRHEGTHQLFHAYGILSGSVVEPTWINEGLAQYCEPPEIGGDHRALAERVTQARRAGKLLPLHTLLNHHGVNGFFSLGGEKTAIAYAESWALVKFLMQDKYHDAFFNFIKRSRTSCHLNADGGVDKTDIGAALAKFLNITSATLETDWREFLAHL